MRVLITCCSILNDLAGSSGRHNRVNVSRNQDEKRDGDGRSEPKANGHSKKEEPQYGGVAQLGEHLPCKQGVMGSIPIISTKGEEETRYTETYMGS